MKEIKKETKTNEASEIPVKHQQIVLDRIAKAKTNPERLLDWDEVSKKL